MNGYTKLFTSILDSTIWQEANETRILWITLLAMSDKNGEVQASIPGMARRAGISLSDCEKALSTLLSPDPYSRTTDHDGRRIAAIEGGWKLLNHSKYRELLSLEERRAYNAKKQAEHRERKKGVNDASMTVNHNQQCQHITDSRVQIAEAEAEEEKTRLHTQVFSKPSGICVKTLDSAAPRKKGRADNREEFDAYFREIGLYPRDAESGWLGWEENGWKNKNVPIKDWRMTVRRWQQNDYWPSQRSPRADERDWPKLTTTTTEEAAPGEDLWAKFERNRLAERQSESGVEPTPEELEEAEWN